ncbi:DUF421 domain-containing protein [Hymenobacter sp. HMF4947]|uniref:DUF421 domain-containing protein n=1 Tax=Hymenobacter ginkgonis TaxID=2682976 RepID=A0A7K1TD45_9BACT|nr:YetF domain-containing protein [Hymenobacter ginkgonis]MVN76315.1 DUF421 domain-containing protein [Hymenobacter ginkgonis]
MKDLLDFLFGLHADSRTITAVQLMCRAMVVFFAALALLRLSGPRTFGGNTAFDMVVKIMLGAIMSRAVVAASPFGGTLLASLVFVLLHRLLAWASFRSAWVGKLVKGQTYVLAEQGQPKPEQLSRLNLTENDLLESLHENGNLASLDQAERVYLERDGSISVVKKAKHPDKKSRWKNFQQLFSDALASAGALAQLAVAHALGLHVAEALPLGFLVI